MKLIFLGPPGAGKGTMAKILSRRYQVPHISTGDLLRANIEQKTELGKQAVAFVEKGQLVPDTLVIEMVKDRLKKSDTAKGFILDGFPRTEPQAKALDELLESEKIRVNFALNFDASDATIIDRVSGRRTCGKCGEIYHLKNIPPKVEGVCDRCGSALVQRKDDTEETIRKRLEVYRRETAPLIQYYDRKKLLRNVPANLEVAELEPALEKLMV